MNSRQAFEAHILRTTPTAELDMNNGEYIVQSIQYQWLGWQACRKELSETEPVLFAFFDHNGEAYGVSSRGCAGQSQLIIRPTEE